MRRPRLGITGLVPFLVLIFSGPAAMAIPEASIVDPRLADARAVALDARNLLQKGRLADIARFASGRVAPSEPPASTPLGDVPQGVPTTIAGPIATLLGAVEHADHEARGAVRDAALATSLAADLTMNPVVTRPVAGELDSELNPDRLASLRGLVDRAVDLPRILAAGVEVARALDEALPALVGSAASSPRIPDRVVGCDIVDQIPVLCVGGLADNLYTEDAALVIDLGGNDFHRHTAGGAAPLNSEVDLAAAVTLDLGGDDVYEAPLERSTIAQGAGQFGVGILVDTAGNDSYRMLMEDRGALNSGSVSGQGSGGGGFGMLADLGGNDEHLVVNHCLCTDLTGAGFVNTVGSAGGFGGGGAGVGILLDRSGDDRYVAESRMTPFDVDGNLFTHWARAGGFGVGNLGGAGLFLDGGGADEISIGASAVADPSGTLPKASATATAAAQAAGLGYALAGSGIAVLGSGSTHITVRVGLTHPYSHGATQFAGLGLGQLGGLGIVSDPGGYDIYDVYVRFRAWRRMVVDDSCGCSGARADTHDPGTFLPGLSAAQVYGMGFGALGGVGLLEDLSGSDRYRAAASNSAEAQAVDLGSVAVPPSPDDPLAVEGAFARAEAGSALVYAQGSASVNAAGFLWDGGGDDVYETAGESVATAEGSATRSDAPEVGVASSQMARSFSQAGAAEQATAALLDFGGRDTYSALHTSTAEADPATQVQPGSVFSFVQSATTFGGQAVLLDANDGETRDTFAALPLSQAVCVGTRGGAFWKVCPDETPSRANGTGAFGMNTG